MDSFASERRLLLPLLVVGGVAALALVERCQLWQSGGELAAVGLMLTLPLGCAGLGVVGGRWLKGLDRLLAVRLLLGALAAFVAWAFVAVQLGWWVVVAEAGLLALVVAPPLVLLTLWALRPRARAGSLLARASERAHWCLVAAVACGGALLALPDWYGLREFYGSGTLVVWAALGLGLLTLGVCALSSARDLRRARRALRDEASLQPVAAGHVSPSTRLLDIGVGDRMLGEVTTGGSAYRACEQVSRVVVGDPGLGAGRLARAHRRLLWACLAASVCVGLGGSYAIAQPYVSTAAEVAEGWRLAGQEPAAAPPPVPVRDRMPGGTGLQTFTP